MKRLNVRKFNGTLRSVAVYREFEVFGFRFFVHRAVGATMGYRASEFSTGYGVPTKKQPTTAKQTEQDAIKFLEKHGKRATKKVISLVLREFDGLANEVKP
jgi:hypothetical protein